MPLNLLPKIWRCRRQQKVVVVLLVSLLAALSASAQEADEVDAADTVQGMQFPEAVTVDGVGGLVVNATTTGLGQEFFRNFNEFWREKPEGEKFTLTIIERASRRTGTQITVVYGQKTMFAGFLPYKLNLIRGFAEQAVEAAYGSLISLEMFAAPASDSDLGRDEL